MIQSGIFTGYFPYGLKETAEKMKTRGPKVEVVEFDGVGHAPPLLASRHIDVVRRWLLQ